MHKYQHIQYYHKYQYHNFHASSYSLSCHGNQRQTISMPEGSNLIPFYARTWRLIPVCMSEQGSPNQVRMLERGSQWQPHINNTLKLYIQVIISWYQYSYIKFLGITTKQSKCISHNHRISLPTSRQSSNPWKLYHSLSEFIPLNFCL